MTGHHQVQSESFGLVTERRRYNTRHIFHRRVWYWALSLCYACIWSSGIILIPQAVFVPNFVSFVASIAELAHGEISRTQSLTHSPSLFDARGRKLLLRNINICDSTTGSGTGGQLGPQPNQHGRKWDGMPYQHFFCRLQTIPSLLFWERPCQYVTRPACPTTRTWLSENFCNSPITRNMIINSETTCQLGLAQTTWGSS